jgi:WD40 repeat protein
LIHSVVALQNGDIARGSQDFSIKIWNPNEGTLKRTLNGHTSNVHALTLLKSGDLVSGSLDRTIKIWNPNDGFLKKT